MVAVPGPDGPFLEGVSGGEGVFVYFFLAVVEVAVVFSYLVVGGSGVCLPGW